MYAPYNNGTHRPDVADWMAAVQSLLPPIDFDLSTDSDQPNRRPDTSDVGLPSDDFQLFPDLTNEVFSSSLPLLCDYTLDDSFSFANGSDNSYPISPLTEIIQSTPMTDTRPDNHQHNSPSPRANPVSTAGTQQKDTQDLRCWDHGCNGQLFTTISNLKRHQREKSSQRPSYPCNMCGAIFSRTTARNHHIQNQSCNRIRRHSNGRQRPSSSMLRPVTS